MQELLEILEKNSRISVKDLAVMLEEDEAESLADDPVGEG